jgi:hypothetical protein
VLSAIFALDKEYQTANYAIEQMDNFKNRFPNSTMMEQYNVYKDSYNLHANNNIIGRQLTKVGVMQPAAPETIFSRYDEAFKQSVELLNKKP